MPAHAPPDARLKSENPQTWPPTNRTDGACAAARRRARRDPSSGGRPAAQRRAASTSGRCGFAARAAAWGGAIVSLGCRRLVSSSGAGAGPPIHPLPESASRTRDSGAAGDFRCGGARYWRPRACPADTAPRPCRRDGNREIRLRETAGCSDPHLNPSPAGPNPATDLRPPPDFRAVSPPLSPTGGGGGRIRVGPQDRRLQPNSEICEAETGHIFGRHHFFLA